MISNLISKSDISALYLYCIFWFRKIKVFIQTLRLCIFKRAPAPRNKSIGILLMFFCSLNCSQQNEVVIKEMPVAKTHTLNSIVGRHNFLSCLFYFFLYNLHTQNKFFDIFKTCNFINYMSFYFVSTINYIFIIISFDLFCLNYFIAIIYCGFIIVNNYN